MLQALLSSVAGQDISHVIVLEEMLSHPQDSCKELFPRLWLCFYVCFRAGRLTTGQFSNLAGFPFFGKVLIMSRTLLGMLLAQMFLVMA